MNLERQVNLLKKTFLDHLLESFLGHKCDAYPLQSLFHDNTCYVWDSTRTYHRSELRNGDQICNHIHGFKSAVAKSTPELIALLEREFILDVCSNSH